MDPNYTIIDYIIPQSIFLDENIQLSSIPLAQEVERVVFSLDLNNALWAHSYTNLFYYSCWDIIAMYITEAIQSFFRDGSLPTSLKSNFMVLILKVPKASRIKQYKTIALADRLACIASRITSPNKFGFIKGSHIKDYISVASDCINILDKN